MKDNSLQGGYILLVKYNDLLMKCTKLIYSDFLYGRKQVITFIAYRYSNIFVIAWFAMEIFIYYLYYNILFIVDMAVIDMIVIYVHTCDQKILALK